MRAHLFLIVFCLITITNADEPVVIKSYFSQGFGVLIDVECKIIELRPERIGGESVYILFKKDTKPDLEKHLNGLIIHAWTKEILQELVQAMKKEPNRVFKVTGFESFCAKGEPSRGNTLHPELILGGFAWSMEHFFQLRKIH